VGLEVNPDPVRQNEPMHPRITVTNRSGSTLFNVRAIVRLPDTINGFPPALFGGGPGTQPGCSGYNTGNCDPFEVLTWTIGNLPAGAGAMLSMPAVIAAATPDGRPTNWEVTVLADGNNIGRATHSVTTDAGSALALNVDTSAGTVAVNGALTYSLTYGNRGISSLSSTTLTFPIPAGATN
jgi:hypothetical protein